MENHHFQWENPLYMVIFNSYVSLPEGTAFQDHPTIRSYCNPSGNPLHEINPRIVDLLTRVIGHLLSGMIFQVWGPI